MKISENFKSSEWLDKEVINFCNARGLDHRKFINPRLVHIAEFYKKFFREYFRSMDPNVIDVLIIINKRGVSGRGLRGPDYKGKGAKYSQHKFLQAFDCDIVIVYENGDMQEADYEMIHQIIMTFEEEFMAEGVTTLEDPEYATTWLHTSIEWVPDQKHIQIVKP